MPKTPHVKRWRGTALAQVGYPLIESGRDTRLMSSLVLQRWCRYTRVIHA